MLRRSLLLLCTLTLLGAAPPPKPKTVAQPKLVAPASMPHPVAMFLANLCNDGKKKISFKAAAIGTRFFFEEDSGVTVYAFDGNSAYTKETFLKGYTLAKALKKYGR
jgi:hypothetical protein